MKQEQLSQLCVTIAAGKEAKSIFLDFLNKNKEKILVEGAQFRYVKGIYIKEIQFDDDDGSPKSFMWEDDNDCYGDYVNFPASAYLNLDGWVAEQKEKHETAKRLKKESAERWERAQLEELKKKYP